MEKIKIGIFGMGYLGKIHTRILQNIPGYHIIGFYDPDPHAKEDGIKAGLKKFDDSDLLISLCDAIDVVCTTSAHYEVAKAAITAGKHVFIEKPITETPEQAAALLKLSEEKGIKAMAGHVERFNPAILPLKFNEINPLFIEVHRLAMFNPRGTDVSVIHDLMIHDLDIMLCFVSSPIRKIHASGVAILSDTPDIANARIEFENGCVANVTASRIAMKSMRKMRIFQKGKYISIDFLQGKSEILQLLYQKPHNFNGAVSFTFNGKEAYITTTTLSQKDINAIELEFRAFYDSITKNKPVPVGLSDGYKALILAKDILEHINQRNQEVLESFH
ncbi:MAG: Gfo/Idh/MocA family oxidoreductase [Chitinophagales bacterium]|nr:Gfo/Idh/MocA family oxidoreductase [Chitinophagales bacterium]